VTAVARRIAEFVLDTRAADVPPADRAAIETSCFDLVGVLLAGRTSRHAAMVERLVRAEGGPAECTVLGAGLRVPAVAAALSNATAAHADDFDDMGGYGHPSAPLLPALLAAAELRGGASGAELVTAYAVGFEVGAALCQLGHYDQYTRCFHSTPVFGTLAAACAVARLLRLDVDRTAAALAAAATFASGIGRNSGTMVKPLHAGQGASNAVLAVLLARDGVSGAERVFEAQGGFWANLFGTPTSALDAIVDTLGSPFRAAKSLFVKEFPCCGTNQSALHAIRRLMAGGLRAADVAEVVVHGMNETSPVLRYPRPAYGLNGKFSIRFTVGSLLAHGRLGIDEFADEYTSDPGVLSMSNRVRPDVLSRWDSRNAGKRAGNPVTVTTRDGRRFDLFVRRPEMPGSPSRPLAEDVLVAKFTANAARCVAEPAALVPVWRRLAGLADVRDAIGVTAG
jgi:2-methylcitrate dehydratase PrpD